jgi:3-methyl-2-oxobutanoate hydroxymethyltransferase
MFPNDFQEIRHTRQPLSYLDLQIMKQQGEIISCLTAYDASFAQLIDQAMIDVILIGDSLGMVIQGHSTTLPVTLEDVLYHTRCVTKTCQRPFVVADLPFMTYFSPHTAAQNAACLIREGAQMVKIEGAKIDIVEFLVKQGIAVCGHLGLLPQSIHQMGRYKVQGKVENSAQMLQHDALALEKAGISMLVLECIPAKLACQISQQLTIPVIGIGAGNGCDGQILVIYDALGISPGMSPRFSKNFLHDASSIQGALENYRLAVKKREFPTPAHSF